MNIQTLPGDTVFVVNDGMYKMSSVAYHRDPCPLPSFTQSIAKILLDYSPRHAWHAHPRLNPNYQEDADTKFAIGNVAHRLWLGAGKDFEVFDYDDWNASGGGKGAKTALHEARDAARALGKVPILRHQFERAQNMVDVARKQGACCASGHREIVLCWEEDGIWLRTMIDSVSENFDITIDLKTTDQSAGPNAIGRLMANAGWDIQAAMFERALGTLAPDGMGRREFRFIALEAYEPYCVLTQTIPESALTIGRKKLEYALDLWRKCLISGEWPGYEPKHVSVPLPGWSEEQWLKRELEEHDRIMMQADQRPIASPANVILAG